MVATRVAWSPSLTPALTTVTSFREYLEQVPARLGLCSDYDDGDNYVWTKFEETKWPLLADDDTPGLDLDLTRRRRAVISFVRADDDHPLAYTEASAPPTACVSRALSTAVSADKRRRSTVSKERKAQSALEPKPAFEAENTDIDETQVEMTTWRQRHVPLQRPMEHSTRQAPRLNRDFLRMYIAQKLMYEHGKINEISCSLFLPPRQRPSPNPQCTLGVRHSWNKKYRRREWAVWSPSDPVQ